MAGNIGVAFGQMPAFGVWKMRTTLRFSQEGTRFFTLFMAFLALIWQTHPLSAAHMTVDSFAPFPHIKFFERFGVSQSEDSFHFEQMLSVISTANQKSPFHFHSESANRNCTFWALDSPEWGHELTHLFSLRLFKIAEKFERRRPSSFNILKATFQKRLAEDPLLQDWKLFHKLRRSRGAVKKQCLF